MGVGMRRCHLALFALWLLGACVEKQPPDDRLAPRLGDQQIGPVVQAAPWQNSAWLDAGSPFSLRTGYQATLLTDGRVLITGGEIGGKASATSELYDPRYGKWFSGPSMIAPRAFHTAILHPGGAVLITGGSADEEFAEVFYPIPFAFALLPPPPSKRMGATATLLLDGRVLVAGGKTPDGQPNVNAELFDFSSVTWSKALNTHPPLIDHTATRLLNGDVLFTAAPGIAQIFHPNTAGFSPAAGSVPMNFLPPKHRATLLRDGRVLLTGGDGCTQNNGDLACSAQAFVYDAQGASFSELLPGLPMGMAAHSSTLLPSGEVLLAGGLDDASAAILFDPNLNQFSAAPSIPGLYKAPTATLLPSGDVLLISGEQAQSHRFVSRGGGYAGSFSPVPSAAPFGLSRSASAVLSDGRVLITGGSEGTLVSEFGSISPAAMLFDLNLGDFSALPPMASPRIGHTITPLWNQGALIVGGRNGGSGPLASTEYYNPSSAQVSQPGPNLAFGPRAQHAAVLLCDGSLMVLGGVNGQFQPLDTAEWLSPGANQFEKISAPMTMPRANPKAILMANGRVLVESDGSAEVFDPLSKTFHPVQNPGTFHDEGATLTQLPSGNILLFGGSGAMQGEIFDPQTESWSFTASAAYARSQHGAILLPIGKVLIAGGLDRSLPNPIPLNSAELFDPAASGGKGAFIPAGDLSEPRYSAFFHLLPNGRPLMGGGRVCSTDACNAQPLASAEIFALASGEKSFRPILSYADSPLGATSEGKVQGINFIGLEASSGASNSSAATNAFAVWESAAGGAMVLSPLVNWTDETVYWRPSSVAFSGPGWLRILRNGVISANAVPVSLNKSPAATSCQADAECSTGYCAGGVCCDRACDGDCEACAVAAGANFDGICVPISASFSNDDACVASLGAPCLAASDCSSGHCVDGVCCYTECAGQCEACDEPGVAGLCIAVYGRPHGARPACSTHPSDPCLSSACDGSSRESCKGQVGPCDAYACTHEGCLTSCTQSSDCAADYYCDESSSTCAENHCRGSVLLGPEDMETDCAPYRCYPDGQCGTSCTSLLDCADGFVCNLEHACIARPALESPSSCQISLPGNPSPDRVWLFWLGLGALGLVARKGRN